MWDATHYPAKPITSRTVSEDHARLKAIAADRNSPQQHVLHARIVLLTAAGCGTAEIMRQAGVAKTAVWRWQERFMAEGVSGLLRGKTDPSRVPPLNPAIAPLRPALTPVRGVYPLPQRRRARRARGPRGPHHRGQQGDPQAPQGRRLAEAPPPRWSFHFTLTSASWLAIASTRRDCGPSFEQCAAIRIWSASKSVRSRNRHGGGFHGHHFGSQPGRCGKPLSRVTLTEGWYC